MATNPITSESLTVDFRSLMKIPVGDRAKAASISPDFLQSILNALTPIQIANAFPNYYKRQLPDVSNFVTSYITSRNGGNFNQTGGGNDGSAYPYYDGETKHGGVTPAGTPPPTIQEMKEKLLKQGIDVDGTLNLVKEGAVLAGDERLSAIKGMTDDELKAIGMQRSEDESGKTIIQMVPSQYEGMSEAQVLEEYKKKFPKADISPRERATLDFIAKREGSKDPNVIFGDIGGQGGTGQYSQQLKNMGYTKPLTEMTITEVRAMQKDLIKLTKGRIGKGDLGTSAVGSGQMIGSTLETNLKALGIPQDQWDEIKFDKDLQDRLTLQNFKTMGIGDPNAPPSTWNHGALGQQYESLDTSKHPAMSQSEMAEIDGKSAIRPERKDDITSQEALRKLQEAESSGYADELTKRLFNQASPTSSEAIPDPEGRTVLESQNEIAGVRKKPITPELKEVLQYAGEESGVIVEVFSGGQNDITQGGPRKGTERHDLGHAADVKLKVRDADGKMRTLDSRNPEDRAIMSKFVETARMMGAKGIGSGLGYMGESGIHIGTVMRPDLDYSNKEYGAPAGKEAVWLSDKWTQEAFSRGQQAAVDFEKAGGMAGYRERREEKIAEQQKKESDKTVAAKQQEEIVQITEKSGAELLPESHPFSMTPEKKKRIIEAQNAKTETTTPESTPSSVETPVAETPPVVIESKETIVAETPPAVIESPVPVESKETIVVEAPTESKETTVAEIPVPVEPKETTAAAPPPAPDEVRKYALGGNIYEPNEDMTLVDTKTGNPIAQIGNDEKIEKTGNAIQVTPETKLKADELTNKYDSSTEMEDRMSSIEDNMQNQKTPDTTNQIVQKAREPEKTQTETPHRWRESVASAERPVSPSFNRAMARSKFFGEGHHFNRSAPGSQS